MMAPSTPTTGVAPYPEAVPRRRGRLMESSEMTRLRKCFQPWQWFFSDCEDDINPSSLNDEVIFMWVYRQIENRYHVGYFMPDGTWFTDASYDGRDDAVKRVNYLNGGHA